MRMVLFLIMLWKCIQKKLYESFVMENTCFFFWTRALHVKVHFSETQKMLCFCKSKFCCEFSSKRVTNIVDRQWRSFLWRSFFKNKIWTRKTKLWKKTKFSIRKQTFTVWWLFTLYRLYSFKVSQSWHYMHYTIWS